MDRSRARDVLCGPAHVGRCVEGSFKKRRANLSLMGVDISAKIEVVGTKIPEEEVKRVVLSSLNLRLSDVDKTIGKLQLRIKEFEERYGFSSRDFTEKSGQGVLEDDVDFLEWETCIDLLKRLSKEREALKEILD